MKFRFLATWSFVLAALSAHLALGAAPSPRYNHSAIWTGSEMIVWGGNAADGTALGDGARYDPGAKTWTPISTLNAPAARYDHTVVWTGTEMILWGGRSSGFNFLTDGARYHPVSNQWFSLNPSGAPTPRVNHRAVWTGSEMIVWGGLRNDFNFANDGARYHPASNSWLPMTTNGAPVGRGFHSAVWTGDRMIVWGGNGTIVQGTFHDGGRYDPVANSWSSLSTNNGPAGRYVHATVWTGNEMIIWGGYDGAAYPASGGRYHAASDSWSVLPTLAAPNARGFASAVWTGTDMIVWGGGDGTNRNTGGRYNLLANTWTATTTNSAPAARSQHTAIWSGNEMVVWAGRNNTAIYDDVGRYNAMVNSWTTFAPWVYTLDFDASPLGPYFIALNGTVNPNGTNTSAWFEWGVTTNYGNITLAQSIGSGTNDTNFSHTLEFGGGVTFHYRAVASNGLGTAYGGDRSLSLPQFSLATNLPGVTTGAAAWGDYDNDGRLDLLLVGGTNVSVYGAVAGAISQIWRNTINGFVNVTGLVAPGLPGVAYAAVAWGDFDRDGRLDFLLTGFAPTGRVSQIWRNTGASFTNVTIALAPGLPAISDGSVAWGDYDHDGRPDFLLTGYDVTFRTQLWRNTGSGFQNVPLPASAGVGVPGMFYSSVSWTDYDSDGRLDYLLMGSTNNPPDPLVDYFRGTAQLWRNTADGFVNVTAALLPSFPGLIGGSAAWGDADNDGRPDLLVTGYTYTGIVAQVWRNTGGAFSNLNVGLPPIYNSSAVWGDYDNDGRADILLAGRSASGNISQVWRNTGGGFTNLNVGLPGIRRGSVTWADYDQDGRLDFLIIGSTNVDGHTNLISQLWRNHGFVTNTPPDAPHTLAVTVATGVATFSWNAPADAQTPAAGLSYNLRIGTTPGGSDVFAPNAAPGGGRRLPQTGQAGQSLMAMLRYQAGTPYYWSVQAVDSAFAGSPFSSEGSFRIFETPPVVTPVTTTSLAPGDLNGDGLVDQNELNLVLANYFPNSPFLQMTNVAGLGGTNVTFTLSNSTAGAFSVEVTTNLVDWNFLGPATPRYLFTDTNAPLNPQRYYRLRWP